MKHSLPEYVRLARVAVAAQSGGSVRERECAATLEALRELVGPGARIEHYADGAPYAVDREGVTHPISVSHDADYGVVVTAENVGIGVDSERLRPQLARVAGKFVTEEEERERGCSLHDLLLLWTAKEAVYKLLRTPGLELRKIVVSREFERASAILPSGERVDGIELYYPECGEDRAVCVAIGGK